MTKKKYSKKNNKPINLYWPGGSLNTSWGNFMQGMENKGINTREGLTGIGEGTEQLFDAIVQMMDKTKSDTELIDQIGLNNIYAGGGALGWAQMGTDIATSIIDDVNKSKGRNISSLEDAIRKGGNIKVASGNFDEIMAQRGLMGEFNHVSARDLGRRNFTQTLLSSSGEAASGFTKGVSNTGNVWAGVAQGIVSGVGDIFSSVFSNKANKRKARRLNNLIDRANYQKNFTYNQALENTEKQQYINALSNMSAYGGPINMEYSGVMSPFGNQFKDGGIYIKPSKRGTFTKAAKERGLGVQEFASKVLANPEDYTQTMRKKAQFAKNASKWHSLGGPLFNDFTNGVTIIGNGDSHENNPFEGVQIGVDPQGVPNLVEEGEVIFNNYVFSDRLKVPNATRNKYKLKGNKDLTFADAAKQMQKESEERPNDPISKRGLEDNMMKLMTIQEQIRQKEESNKYAKGGKLGILFAGPGDKSNVLNPYPNYTILPEDTDFYDKDYLAFWDWMNNNRTEQKAIDWLNRINSREFGDIGGNTFNFDDILRLAKDYKKGPVHNAFYEASRAFNKENSNINTDVNLAIKKDFMDRFAITPSRLSSTKGMQTPSEVITQRPYVGNEEGYTPIAPINIHPLRYASTIGQFASVLNNLLGGNEPDYSNLASFENASRNIRAVNHTPIGNYLMYKPFDRNYYQNMLTAASNASRRAARNISGGNRAQALAGILATDYNEGIKLGELARQAEEYNWARRQQVEDFNRATNMFNSELGFKAGATNAELDAKRAALLGEVARMRELERMSNRKEKIDANTAFLTSLDNIGREKTYLDMLRWMEENKVLESKKGYGRTKGKTTKR